MYTDLETASHDVNSCLLKHAEDSAMLVVMHFKPIHLPQITCHPPRIKVTGQLRLIVENILYIDIMLGEAILVIQVHGNHLVVTGNDYDPNPVASIRLQHWGGTCSRPEGLKNRGLKGREWG